MKLRFTDGLYYPILEYTIDPDKSYIRDIPRNAVHIQIIPGA